MVEDKKIEEQISSLKNRLNKTQIALKDIMAVRERGLAGHTDPIYGLVDVAQRAIAAADDDLQALHHYLNSRAEQPGERQSISAEHSEPSQSIENLDLQRLLDENRTQTSLLQRQEDLLRTIFEVDPTGLAVVSEPDLTFRFANLTYRLLTPHPEMDPVGHTYAEIWPKQEDFRGHWLLNRVWQTGKSFHIDRYALPYPNGKTRYFSIQARSLLWEKQRALLLVLWETTWLEEAYSHAEQAAQEAERRAKEAEEGKRILDAIMTYIPEGIAIADGPQAYIRQVSSFGQTLAERQKDELENISMDLQPERWGIYHLDRKTLARPEELPLSRAVQNGEVIKDEEWVLRTAGGRDVYILCTAGPILSPEGTINGGVFAWRDITDRMQSEEAVRNYASQLERSNRELQDFAFIASHDLQEPLRKIQSFGNLLINEFGAELGEKGQDYTNRMQDAAERMQRMISDLLSYSRVTTKAQPFSRISLNQAVQEALVDLEIAIHDSQGRMEVSQLPDVDADPVQIRQLLQNLIGNALKFRRSGVPPVVKIRAAMIDQKGPNGAFVPAAQIFVEDNGIGFSEEFIERIFQPFQRLHGRNQYPGSGIGLAICRKIVDRHGGSITARSTVGKGSVFIITLPLRQDQGEGLEG